VTVNVPGYGWSTGAVCSACAVTAADSDNAATTATVIRRERMGWAFTSGSGQAPARAEIRVAGKSTSIGRYAPTDV
jgi:hypothetical protein